MSNEVFHVRSLIIECRKRDPDLNKINDHINQCRNKQEDMNTLFIDYPFGKFTTLQVACSHGHHAIVYRLLDRRNNHKFSVDVNATNYNYYGRPVYPLPYQHHESFLLCQLSEAIKYYSTPLHIACYGNLKSIVTELLNHPNINLTAKDRDGHIPLHTACRCIFKDTNIIQMLLGHQQQKHRIVQLIALEFFFNDTPLHVACSSNNCRAVVEILKHANDIDLINVADRVGNTSLCIACSKKSSMNNDRVNIIKILLEQPSIMIHKKNNCNETPIDIIKRTLCHTHYKDRKHKYLIEILQLLEDSHLQQRWRKYCFFLNYELNKM